eukprot:Nitzschia sp. Nitz4//scaffold36_size144017//41905//43300//NITZ4_003077-RA/size144017-snap-gene-0.207-mRNA-1//-1//CDS//3329549429//8879//frame0
MLTSTTAPGKTFSSREELADHYKSDWHKYNLKRREANLPMLAEKDFQARWEAALAMKKEKEAKAKSGTSHLKKNAANKSSKSKQVESAATKTTTAPVSKAGSAVSTEASGEEAAPVASKLPAQLAESQENPNIDPRQSLFDSHTSATLQENVTYMQQKYGFFIPDKECLADLEGLLGYCQEKVKLGHYCLYCEKMFTTWQGCQNHMINKQHAKLRYEQGYWDELDPFYDFGRDNAKFSLAESKTENEGEVVVVTDDDGDDGGWEDVPEDEDDAEVFDGYEKEIARFGLDVTPLGELVFPDGRVIGHRALNRYYKQNQRPTNTSTAIVAAKRAAGERLYEGRVINIGQPMPQDQLKGAGKGILVALKDGAEGFSALSLYRYRAAVRKQRRDDEKGRRLQYRTTQNINRMDKKANRLMNGVSVAHASR